MPLQKLSRVAASAAEALRVATAVAIPLAVNPWGMAYELPKAALFRGLVLTAAGAHILATAWAPSRPQTRRRPLLFPVVALVAAGVLSTVLSIDPLISVIGTYHRQQGTYLLVCLVVWALLVADGAHGPGRRRLGRAVAVAGTLVALSPFLEALYWQKNPLTWRPGGSLGNPIFLGAYLIMALPFTLAGLVEAAAAEGRSPGRIAAWSGAAALQIVALLVTQSRGPWVGGLVGLALFAALVAKPAHRRWVLGGVAFTLLLVAVLVAGLRFGLVPGERIAQLPYVRRIAAATDFSGGTVRVRLVLWEAAADVIARWPNVGLEPDPLRFLRPVIGYGTDTGSIVYTAAYPPELAHIEDPDAIWDRAHNETLDLLVMQGALGLAVNVFLGLACLRRGLHLWRRASDLAGQAAVAAPLAALVAHAVEVQFAFTVTATAMMAWLCVGLLASAGEGGEAQRARPETSPRSASARWWVCGAVGVALLLAVVVRVEAATLWADTLVARARALGRAGRWDESIELFQRVHTLTPWQPIYYQFHAEALYNLAQALPEEAADLKEGLLQAADRNLTQARLLDPLELEYYANAGILHAYWSETADTSHLAQAVQYLQQAIRLAPTRVDLRVTLGHVYHNHGLYEQALAQYDAALRIDPAWVAAHYGAAMAWERLGQVDRARAALRETLELAPNCEPCRAALEALPADGSAP